MGSNGGCFRDTASNALMAKMGSDIDTLPHFEFGVDSCQSAIGESARHADRPNLPISSDGEPKIRDLNRLQSSTGCRAATKSAARFIELNLFPSDCLRAWPRIRLQRMEVSDLPASERRAAAPPVHARSRNRVAGYQGLSAAQSRSGPVLRARRTQFCGCACFE